MFYDYYIEHDVYMARSEHEIMVFLSVYLLLLNILPLVASFVITSKKAKVEQMELELRFDNKREKHIVY